MRVINLFSPLSITGVGREQARSESLPAGTGLSLQKRPTSTTHTLHSPTRLVAMPTLSYSPAHPPRSAVPSSRAQPAACQLTNSMASNYCTAAERSLHPSLAGNNSVHVALLYLSLVRGTSGKAPHPRPPNMHRLLWTPARGHFSCPGSPRRDTTTPTVPQSSGAPHPQHRSGCANVSKPCEEQS